MAMAPKERKPRKKRPRGKTLNGKKISGETLAKQSKSSGGSRRQKRSSDGRFA